MATVEKSTKWLLAFALAPGARRQAEKFMTRCKGVESQSFYTAYWQAYAELFQLILYGLQERDLHHRRLQQSLATIPVMLPQQTKCYSKLREIVSMSLNVK